MPPSTPSSTGAKHIGIVGVSPEGTALCYREIFRFASKIVGDHGHPTATIHNEPLDRYVEAVLRNDWHAIGDLLRKSADILAKAGAEFCITPDNLMQNGVHLAQVGSAIPWLTMPELVADAAVRGQRKSVGLVGTRMVMLGSVYQTHLGLRGVHTLIPDEEDINTLDSIIFSELIHGTVNLGSVSRFQTILERLAQKGCDAVILGSTEIPLLVGTGPSALPLIDSNSLLAEAAAHRSLGR